MIDKLKRIFGFRPTLDHEAFYAYLNKLPEAIQVSWCRDGDFIVGDIVADGYKFMTQAKSAEEFIEMVNDSLLTVYEIPKEYFDALLRVRTFIPNPKEYEELNDASIKKSNFNIDRRRVLAPV